MTSPRPLPPRLEPRVIRATRAQPFLKWAGGKGSLLTQLAQHFPPGLYNGQITRYVEPFVGGGAVFFHVAHRIAPQKPQSIFISDMNGDLVRTYRTVKHQVRELIGQLQTFQETYLPLDDERRKAYYYDVRDAFNSRIGSDVLRTAQLIFLNRTGYNGLYRVNQSGGYNVPHGRYKKPNICNEETLHSASNLLIDAEIHEGDFELCADFVDDRTFVYFDPPYRPLTRTASFNSYSSQPFDDDEQLRLADFFRKLHAKGAKLMLSNSDPKNSNAGDDFFEDAYAGFRIERVSARRNINSNANKRGKINELLIMNYG